MLDYLPDIETLSLWLSQYGSITLFFLLASGIVLLPVPEETLMVVAGVLMHCGTLSTFPTVLAALLGSICGITVSYILGKTAGAFLIQKYGKWVGITALRLEKAHNWFERFGKWTLTIGYFVPGVRHFTGLCAGISQLHFQQFALFAYVGALIWVSTFLSIGYFFGTYWVKMYEEIEISLDVVAIILAAVACLAIIYIIRKFRRKRK
jgi:Uncharacterized membrane-associated protein